jgi:hypothetical protein
MYDSRNDYLFLKRPLVYSSNFGILRYICSSSTSLFASETTIVSSVYMGIGMGYKITNHNRKGQLYHHKWLAIYPGG